VRTDPSGEIGESIHRSALELQWIDRIFSVSKRSESHYQFAGDGKGDARTVVFLDQRQRHLGGSGSTATGIERPILDERQNRINAYFRELSRDILRKSPVSSYLAPIKQATPRKRINPGANGHYPPDAVSMSGEPL
jgi:hypothetical protein